MNSLEKYNFKDEQGHPLENCQDYIDLLRRAEAAESSLAAMRQRAQEAEKDINKMYRDVDEAYASNRALVKERDAALARAERAEESLRDFVSILSIPHPVESGTYRELLTTAFGRAKELLGVVPDPGASPPADASTMVGDHISQPGKKVGERELRLLEALRHVCTHLCQWKDACETGCLVSAALSEMEQKS